MKARIEDLRIDDRGYLTSLKAMNSHEWNILLGELFTAYTELKQANELMSEAIAEELFPGTLDALEDLTIRDAK
jgi:hypothetical protein